MGYETHPYKDTLFNSKNIFLSYYSYMLEMLLIIPGILLLMKGADYFVESASSLALKLNVKPIFIGLTIVAFGTSFPELVVNLISATSGSTQIAFGNVVGSNIANLLLILGVSATITKLKVNSNTVWKELPMSFLATVILLIFGLQEFLNNKNFNFSSFNFTNAEINFTHGLILLSFFIIFIYYTFGIAKNTETIDEDINEQPLGKSILFIFLGLIAIILGGKFTVDSAVSIASMFGVSETLIGLTIVAVGTSLPELVTSIIAAKKNQADLAIGNVIGSNIFNIFFILGITSLVKNIPINLNNLIDLIFLMIITFYVFVSLFISERHKLGKFEGISMVSLYVFYTIYLIYRG
jgi:cation:H+ antiporter